jgi:hypothetical protein
MSRSFVKIFLSGVKIGFVTDGRMEMLLATQMSHAHEQT